MRLPPAMTTARTIPLMLPLVCFSLHAAQRVTIPTPGAVYTATVDDSLPAAMKLRLLPVFSPIVDTSEHLNHYLTATDTVSDKVMLSPLLDDCRHGQPNCPPVVVNDGFLRNARTNLENGRKELGDLKGERLPESLEPVRRFLLDNLATALAMEEARYRYIATGAVAPLKAILERYCAARQPELMQRLADAPDAETRRELSQLEWHNAVWKCYAAPPRKYPLEAWKRFLNRYGVRETARLLE